MSLRAERGITCSDGAHVASQDAREPGTFYRAGLEALLAGNTIVDVYAKMGLVRMVKTPEEIRRLKKATKVTVQAHVCFRKAIKPGVSDWELYQAAGIGLVVKPL